MFSHKHLVVFVLFLASTSAFAQQNITVQFLGQKDSLWVQLASQSFENVVIVDSAWVHKDHPKHTFQRTAPDGLYLVLAEQQIPVKLLLTSKEPFSVMIEGDSMRQKLRFDAVNESSLFNDYQEACSPYLAQLQQVRSQSQMFQQLGVKDKEAYAELNKVFTANQDTLLQITKAAIARYPGQLWTKVLQANMTPDIPNELKQISNTPEGRKQVLDYALSHFWDQYDFSDKQLINTAAYPKKLTQYMQMCSSSKSQIEAIDMLMPKLKAYPKYYNYTLSKFIQVSYDADRVFVHVADTYFKAIGDGDADMATLERIRFKAQAYRTTLNGLVASEIMLPDTAGQMRKLSELQAKYTILYFYSPLCEKCKVATPKIYQISKKYAEQGIQVFAVALDADQANWKTYTRDLPGWTHVHTGSVMHPLEEAYAIPELPCIYILDKEKKIVLKRFPVDQTEGALYQVMKQEGAVK
jgi:thiol-disulfide isomerase/thioredoxin